MNRAIAFFLAALIAANVACSVRAAETTDTFGRFGRITLYYPSPHPAHVALFFSGDGGWNLGVVDMARQLVALDTLVVGVDITHYLKQLESAAEPCVYPAGDFELLSKYVQKKLGFPQYIKPLLIGYSSGATLVYAALVQAPSNTFLGAISLSFCPDMDLSKPFCRGSGLKWTRDRHGKASVFLPATRLAVPWVVLQGAVDQVCDAGKAEKYVAQVSDGKIVMLPKVGHGFSVPKNWLPQFKKVFAQLTERSSETPLWPSAGTPANLPLVAVAAPSPGSDCMAVFWSGDGGWADLDKEISAGLAERGIPVVGVNSLKYFWTKRTPEQTAQDLAHIIRQYAAEWHKEKVVLVGYSQGADILPFAVNRLQEEVRSRVELIVLLGPSLQADFEFHISNWLGSSSSGAPATVPEIMQLGNTRLLCIYGEREADSACPDLHGNRIKKVALPGAHHFDGNYARIVESILGDLK